MKYLLTTLIIILFALSNSFSQGLFESAIQENSGNKPEGISFNGYVRGSSFLASEKYDYPAVFGETAIQTKISKQNLILYSDLRFRSGYIFNEQINEFEINQNTDFKAKLDFFHPCKELIFTFQFNDYINNSGDTNKCLWNNFSLTPEGTGNPIAIAQFFLNKFDRTPKLPGDYFNYVIPFECHRHTPSDGVNVFSFALHPELFQPSGTCNLSKIDLATLEITFDPVVSNAINGGILKVFAVNYNILRFYGGMAGEAFYP